MVKLSEVKVGNILIADGGFTCIKKGAELVVKQDIFGFFVVDCDQGTHHLDGQLDDNGELAGLKRKE